MNSPFFRILLLVASLFFINISSADTLHGRVVGVADGDTVTVLDNTNILFEIDNGINGLYKHVQEETLHRIRSCLHNGNVARTPAMVDF